jgi:GNAT superfamily N-acetyltransferase
MTELVCSRLAEPDRDEVIALLATAFCQDDPVEAALGITPAEFRVLLEFDLEPLIREGACLVVRVDGRLRGAILVQDALDEGVDVRGRISPKFEPISALAGALHEQYLQLRRPEPGCCLYVYMIGVDPGWAGQGIGKRLLAEALRQARSRGCRSAFALATNRGSMAIFQACRFELLRMTEYRDFRFREQAVFASITDHPGIALMECPGL